MAAPTATGHARGPSSRRHLRMTPSMPHTACPSPIVCAPLWVRIYPYAPQSFIMGQQPPSSQTAPKHENTEERRMAAMAQRAVQAVEIGMERLEAHRQHPSCSILLRRSPPSVRISTAIHPPSPEPLDVAPKLRNVTGFVESHSPGQRSTDLVRQHLNNVFEYFVS